MLRLQSEVILNRGYRAKAVLKEFKDNWINVAFANVAARLGVDLFDGQGCVAYDWGAKTAPRQDIRGN